MNYSRHSLWLPVLGLALSAAAGCMPRKTPTVEPAPMVEDEIQRPRKMVVYQMMMRVFGNQNLTNSHAGTHQQNGCGRMSDVDDAALQSIARLGVNYVWYTGILQQATRTDWSAYGIPVQTSDVVKGEAGSPYAIADYYAVSAELADDPSHRMQEFDSLVARTHRNGLRLLIDFVPNHVAREYHSVMKPDGVADLGAGDDPTQAFSVANNFYYLPGQTLSIGQYQETPARASGNDVFSARPSADDWYETVKLNYGIDYQNERSRHFDTLPDTWTKMLDILLYWAGKGVDGFRCDMTEMVPVEFWHYAIAQVRSAYPDVIFVAEIYNPDVYEDYVSAGGFDYLYDKVELYDSLRAVVEGRRPASILSHVFHLPTYDGRVGAHMLNFLENHDEQRIASAFFGGSASAGYPALAVSALCNGNPFMLYFGQELGEPSMDAEGFQGADGRTTIFDYWGLPRMACWHAAGWKEEALPDSLLSVRRRYEQILHMAAFHPAAVEGEFLDLMPFNNEGEWVELSKSVFAFARQSATQTIVVVANFSAQPQTFTLQTGGLTAEPLQLSVGAHDALVIEDPE